MIILSAFFINVSPATAGAPCHEDVAEQVAITSLHEAPERYSGRCVTLKGYASGVAIFTDADAAKRGGRASPHRVGVYSDYNRFANLSHAIPGLWSATGIVDDCGRLEQEAKAKGGPGVLIMMKGYCHYYSGPVIRALSYRPLSAR